MSLFFVDSGCDIDPKQIKLLGIECIELPYKLGDNVFNYSAEFDFTKFYSKCRKDLPIQYVNLSKQQYIDVFEPAFKNMDDIIYVHSSSNIINTRNLVDAREFLLKKYPDRKLELIDSMNLSSGQGIVSYILAEMYRAGDDIEKIVDCSYSIRNEIASYFAIGNGSKLVSNGLIEESNAVGSTLNIQLIVTINTDGKFEIVDKVIGRKKAIAKLVEIIRQQGENIIDTPIGITYTNNASDLNLLKDKLVEYYGNDIKISEDRLTPSNSSLLGTDIIGLSFHVHKKFY